MRRVLVGAALVVGMGCSSAHIDADGGVPAVDATSGADGDVPPPDGAVPLDGGDVLLDGDWPPPPVDAAVEDTGGPLYFDAAARPDSGLPPAPPPDGGVGDRAGDVWDGYIESYMFPSGSDHVHIVFDSASGDGPRTGVIVLGSGSPPGPLPSVPGVAWPAEIDWHTPGGATLPTVWEGYEYPIESGSVVGNRVRVSIHTPDLWAGWCAMQTPQPIRGAPGTWGCLPFSGGFESATECGNNDGVTVIYADCGMFALCAVRSVCACDAWFCGPGTLDTIAFDFSVSGARGDGSVSLDVGLRNVHLTH